MWRDGTALIFCCFGCVDAALVVVDHVVGDHAFAALDFGFFHLHRAVVAVEFVIET